MIKKLICLLIIALFSLPAIADHHEENVKEMFEAKQSLVDSAQAKLDAAQAEYDDAMAELKLYDHAWKGSVSFGYNTTAGNSETSLFNIKLRLDKEVDKNIYLFEFNNGYGQTQNATTLEDETNIDYSSAVGEYKRLLNERWYYGINTDFRRDEIADVKYRVRINPLIGLFLIKEENLSLSFDVSPGYLFEEVGGIEDDYFAPRLNERLDWQISEKTKIFQSAAVTFSVDDSDNYLVEAEAGVESNFYKNLSLIVSVKDVYDNQPAAGFEKNDLLVLTSLGLNF